MLGPAIVEVVAVHGSDHHVIEAQLLHRVGDAPGLEQVERLRLAGGHVAEGAAAGADLAHDHHGGVALRPAFARVGAASLLAHGHELVLAHDSPGFEIALGRGGLYADPVGLARLGSIGAARLLGVALAGYLEIAHDFVPTNDFVTYR